MFSNDDFRHYFIFNLIFVILQGSAVPVQTSDAVTPSDPVDIKERPQTEPMHSAIALQPPHQGDAPNGPAVCPQSPNHLHAAAGLSQGLSEDAAPVTTEVAL